MRQSMEEHVKLIEHFNGFLRDEVNLNQSRIDLLETRVAAIADFVRSCNPFGDHLVRVVPQGSWQHRTIIKPQGNKEFDADLALFLTPVEAWDPKDYVEQLYVAFRSHGTYRNMVTRRTRCVTVDYSGDFHLDIAPIVIRGLLVSSQYAQNRRSNEEEETDPEGYNQWFSDKNKYTRNNMLIKVTRLVKYLRDIKHTFSVPSVLLTTLLGNQVHDGVLFGDDVEECFSDVATSLVTVFDRLDEYLQEHETAPKVCNPVLSDELFSRHWEDQTYHNFRDRINFYKQRIDDAYAEQDRLTSVAKWRKVFGDRFAAVVEVNSEAIPASPLPTALHEQSPKWPVSITEEVEVDAYVYDGLRNRRLGGLNSRGRRITKGLQLKFIAQTTAGPPFEVLWQVVNTGEEAESARDLRGDFYPSEGRFIRWERTKYKGCHWVRCYVVKNGVCVARSSRFVVLIR